MTNRKAFVLAIFAVLAAMGLSTVALGQTSENNFANVSSQGSGVRFDVGVPSGGMTLTVSAPDGRTFSKEFKGAFAEFPVNDKSLPDGVYTYELRLQPSLTKNQRDSLKAGRGNDDEPESDRAGRKRPVLPNMVQSGSFSLVNGQVFVAGMSEAPAKASVQPASAQPGNGNRIISGNTSSRLRNHRLSLLATSMPDQVIPDDLIVQGSACVGLDCVNNESFGFDTIRLKENNTRITFMDTSTGVGFPTEDWTIRANSSSSGGASFLAFVDQGGSSGGDGGNNGTIVFEVDAGAPANSLKVDTTGRIGLRTAAPVLDVHVNTNNTPAMRYEQNNSGGFTAQTWDIGANEANFFVRDVTGGSRLPFRIRPGAPTSSVDISASGNVGIGTASPSDKLDVTGGFGLFEGGLTTGGVRLQANGGTASIVLSADNSTASDFVAIGDIANNFTGVQLYGAGGPRVTVVSSSGNVGIGTAAPDQKLSVNGDASKVGGGSWQNFSDERLKNIKGNFRSGLKAVMQLTPVRYEYLKNNALGLQSDGEHIGFGAQTLRKVIPEAVTQNSNGYLMVNNDPIIWTMLNAIKEQQKEIEELKGQIRKLKGSTSHRRRK